jgi:formylglycine-generating enzyme required for sulfatase activity
VGDSNDPRQWIERLTWVPAASATVTPFQIEKTEVNNAQYQWCVESDICSDPTITSVDDEPYYATVEYADYPVVRITKAQAETYCQFVGRKLPTEAQWEFAARYAGSSGSTAEFRVYPWVGEADKGCSAGVAYQEAESSCPIPAAARPSNVTSSPSDVTALGLLHMASNVAEWVRDGWQTWSRCENTTPYQDKCAFDSNWLATSESDPNKCTTLPAPTDPDDQACISQYATDKAACAKSCNPDRLALCTPGNYSPYYGNSTESVIRGGSYRHSRCFHRLFVRSKAAATTKADWLGFRCVEGD